MMNKETIREIMKAERDHLSQERRDSAHKKGLTLIFSLIQAKKLVLSYSSFGSEFDMQAINQQLAKEGRLTLPRMEKDHLIAYLVGNLHDCIKNKWGIHEPDPKKCLLADELKIDAVLVPAICFDSTHHRLGYGKGFYDKLLPQLKRAQTIGIGYLEQLWTGPLPRGPLDHPLDEILLI